MLIPLTPVLCSEFLKTSSPLSLYLEPYSKAQDLQEWGREVVAVTTVALTAWGNRMSPVFEAACKLCLVEVEDGKVQSRRFESFDPGRCQSLVDHLHKKEVRTLICGAITESSVFCIQSSGIELVPFVSGTIEEVVAAYAKGLPLAQLFSMPGCGSRQRRRGRRRGMGAKH